MHVFHVLFDFCDMSLCKLYRHHVLNTVLSVKSVFVLIVTIVVFVILIAVVTHAIGEVIVVVSVLSS